MIHYKREGKERDGEGGGIRIDKEDYGPFGGLSGDADLASRDQIMFVVEIGFQWFPVFFFFFNYIFIIFSTKHTSQKISLQVFLN